MILSARNCKIISLSFLSFLSIPLPSLSIPFPLFSIHLSFMPFSFLLLFLPCFLSCSFPPPFLSCSFPSLFLSCSFPPPFLSNFLSLHFLSYLSLPWLGHFPWVISLLHVLVRFPTSPTSEQRPSWSPQPLADWITWPGGLCSSSSSFEMCSSSENVIICTN